MRIPFKDRILHVIPCAWHREQVEAGWLVVSCKRCVLHAEQNCSGECEA